MKVSKLLEELNITFKELKRYQPFLNITIESDSQSLPDDFLENLIILINDPSIQKQLKEDVVKEKAAGSLAKNIMKERLKAFYKDGLYKFIAKFSWYFDESNSGKYGFVTLENGSDFYFKGNVVKGIEPNLLIKEDLLVVTVEEKNFYSKGYASVIYRLEDETDLEFMFDQTLNNKGSYFINKIKILWKNVAQNEQEFFKNKISNSIDLKVATDKINLTDIITLLQLSKMANVEAINKLETFISDKLEENELFIFWEKYAISCPFYKIKNQLITKLTSNLTYNIELLKRLTDSQLSEVINILFLNQLENKSSSGINKLKEIVELAFNADITIDLSTLDNESRFYIWHKDIIEELPFEVVYNTLLHWYSSEEEDVDILEIVAKIGEEDYKNMFAKSHLEMDTINSDVDFKLILFFLSHTPVTLKEEFSKIIYNKATSYYRLQLFTLDFTEEVDYNEVVIYTGLLSSESQIIFFKKIIKGIEEGVLDLSLNDLNAISTIDYQTNLYAKDIDGVGLDFTLSIIIQVLNDLSNKEITKRNKIFDIITQQIKTPSDLLVIKGFFQKCSGRSIIEDSKIKLESGEEETIFKIIKKDYFPRFSDYCDGRKSIYKESGLPNHCDKSGFEFWWCENNKCYAVNRTIHTSENWRFYTLEDVLRILKIEYDERQYEILLNVINRVNRFLKHLTCRSCNKILKPKGKSKYAFYGVTLFYCDDSTCKESNKDIYLSHCLNGNCEDIIDSRDSVKCKTEEYSEDSGWYICNNCYACCSTQNLLNRKNNLEMNGHTYHGHLIGHRDKGVLCCKACGNEMMERKSSLVKYNEMLNWFVNKKSNHKNIIKSGQTKYGKWWFLWAKGSFSEEEYRKQLQNMAAVGLNIPDINVKSKEVQLVAEPRFLMNFDTDTSFYCKECDLVVNLNDNSIFDFMRKKAIKTFHNSLFKLTKKLQD